MTRPQSVADNVWQLQYPLRLLGMQIGRNVTVIRLRDGRLVVHSTAPFVPEDVAAINALGEPGWLIDATLFHDSFARESSGAFSGVPYLAPRGFAEVSGVATTALDHPPAAWAGELDVLRLDGVKANEHVVFHRASRTLIVCDLLFNFANAPGWTGWSARHVMRLRDGVGMSFFFRLMVRDRAAFTRSLRRMMEWDFQRIIVGHGDIIDSDARRIASEHFARAGFDLR